MRLISQAFLVTASVLALATAARADVTISSDTTQNMSCGAGVCAPTASDAVLNVSDLQNLLAGGNVTVTTTGSGVQAGNIDVTAKLGWSANALTLDSYQSISVTEPVTVKGKSGLSILTNDGGSGGELAFFGKGHVSFKKLSGNLSINGTAYTLVNSIASLAAAIQNNASGYFALASNYDAGKDGAYSLSPIQTGLKGEFEGLGNTISSLTIKISTEKSGSSIGLFAGVLGTVADVRMTAASITIENYQHQRREVVSSVGILMGENVGNILRSYTDGVIKAPGNTAAGGLVGTNDGTISASESKANASVIVKDGEAGGLVGINVGTITGSYAGGRITCHAKKEALLGGLVAWNDYTGVITNSYARGKVTNGNVSGGFAGQNDGIISTSYSTGRVTGQSYAGGLIGMDGSQSGSLTDTYWDTTTSGITNLAEGAGNIANDPGITGLTTEQLQSGLPSGFDPAIWAEEAGVNDGLPYLLANPQK